MIENHLGYLRHLGRRPGTIYQRATCLYRLRDFLGHDINAASREELLGFVSRGGEDRGAEYRCLEISHVRGYYAWAVEHDHLCDNPASRLRRPRRPKHHPRPIPDESLAYALDAAPEPIRSWFYLAAYGGLRCCEIAQLRGEDYMPRQGLLIIREQKGGDSGAIYPGPILTEELVAKPSKGWWFLRWDETPLPITAGQLSRHANRWLHDHGIPDTIHSMRHWHGTHIYRGCKDIRVTQEAMRHLSIVSTEGYTYIEANAVAQAAAALPRLEVA